MNRFTEKNNSKFGYQKTPTVASSSFRSNSYMKDKGVVDASNITIIKDVGPMLDIITVHGCCISLWHSYRINQAHNPCSLDMVLQDRNSRIQVYIKKEWMFRFESLFEEGQCYVISNFAIPENSGKLPLLPHKYKISFYKGTPSIHNALFRTKLYINRDSPEILLFRQRLKELPEYDESEFKISLFTPQKPMVTIAEIFNRAVKKMIYRIHKENEWAYTACKECNKKVNVVESKAMSSAGKVKLHSTVRTMVLYRLHLDYNVNNNNHTYRCDAVNDQPAFVKQFKEGFLDDEIPTSRNEASGSGESSGSKRVFIDLDDIDSEEYEEGRANKTDKLLTIKVEKEDP
nr:replication protein A 70 kDa DNA-binding subunit B [Tanacetum cinerariifolium]